MRRKILRGVIVGLAAGAFVCIPAALKVFDHLEWKFWDLRLRLLADPERAADEIVGIVIDQYSLDVYGGQGLPWPWPRQMYVALLDFLHAGGAKAVFIDLIFSEGSGYGFEDDEALAAAMARTDRVFLPLFMSGGDPASYLFEREGELRALDLGKRLPPRAMVPEATAVTLPIEPLARAAAGMGNVRFSPDGDAIYRRIPLAGRFRDMILPSLPLALADFLSGGVDLDRIPLDRSGCMILKYHGPSGTYPQYSAAAVINSQALIEEGKPPQIDPREFAGKIVVVGTTAAGLFDFRPGPFGAVTHGMDILATATDNLIREDHISVPPIWVSASAILGFALVAGIGTSLIVKIGWAGLFFPFVLALPGLAAAAAFRSGWWIEAAAPSAAVVMAFLSAVLLNYGIEGRQRRFIKSAFRYYLSPDVIERVIRNPSLLTLGGERREITAFFSDVAGFTSIAESLSPDDLVALLNAYLSEMTDIILAEGGTLDKYEGDAIIAFWNAPLDQPDHALRACRAALECQRRLAEIRPGFKDRFGCDIVMRIGLNSGPAVVGNMGSRKRFDYTAMGDTMNLASRLEGACKFYGVSVLIGEETFRHVQDHMVGREIDRILVMGKSRPVRIYEPLGRTGGLSPETLERTAAFASTLADFRRRNWQRALDAFLGMKGDPVAAVYVERCREFLDAPPPGDWDGVFVLKEK